MDDLRENQQLPTREAVARQFTSKTSEEQQELLARAMQQWQSENTRLYFLVKDSVVISGDWEALDRETIKERCTSGMLRDGVALVAWVNSYYDHTTEEGQFALNAKFKRTMVLKPDGASGSRASMRKRWLEGYITLFILPYYLSFIMLNIPPHFNNNVVCVFYNMLVS